MSGFGSLYYTDCRPRQGLQGGAGFQFQAATPGLAADAMSLVAESALYEAPTAWMRDQRAVADYPASLAHLADGGLLVTASGRYLGKEANGSREGNQFTHAVVTRDGADYGLVRPAQLWEAPWWATGPAAGTELGLLPAHPATGALDTETVRDRVRATPGAPELLLALLSALHHLADPVSRRPIVIVAADPEAVAAWIAAATLLVPSPQALRTTFKIFVADAAYSTHDVIGVHPEWAGHWADTGPDTGLAVFDLDRAGHTDVEPTAEARFWVPRFLTDDVYDIVDAVELAGQFAAARGEGATPTDADRVVALVMGTGGPLTGREQVQAAANWLRTAPESTVGMARETVLDAILEAEPPAPVLRTLADAAASRGWEAIAAIHRGLLAAEVEEALAATAGVPALRALDGLPPLLHIGPPAPAEDRELVESALRGAPLDTVPALLTVARRHKLALEPEQFRGEGLAFARWWLTCTEPELLPDRWSPPPYLVQWVRDVLRTSLAHGGDGAASAIDVVRRYWWRPLWREAARPADALDRLLVTAAYPRLDGAERHRLMRHVVRVLADDPPRGDPPDAVAWRVLFAETRPSLAEVVGFLDEFDTLGVPMSAELVGALCAFLDQVPAGTDAATGIARRITAAGHAVSRGQQYRLEIEDDVRLIADGLRAKQDPPGNPGTPGLATIPPEVMALRAPFLVDAMLDAPHRDRAIDAVRGCPRAVLTPIYRELTRRWPREGGSVTPVEAGAAAFTFALVTAPPGDPEQEVDFGFLRDRLAPIVSAMSREDRAEIERAGGLGEPWHAWVSEIEPRRWSLGRRGRSGRHAAKDG